MVKGKVLALVRELRSPLVLNGYALVFSSGTTSVLGVGYWILAARLYPEEVVGLNSAGLAAMFFLVNMAQFNLVHALNRFIPVAGAATRNLVLAAYLVSSLMAVAASVIFLFGVSLWAPSLSALSSSPSTAAWFIFATVSWNLFALQDGVLVGLRQAKWVPLSSISYALIKLGMIVLFVTLFPNHGVFVSWTLPVMLLVLPVNALIFFRLIPRHVRDTRESRPIAPKSIVRFVAGDYLSSLVWVATVNLLPIVVLERVGASSSAYFYLAWSIAYTLYFVSVNMCMSLVTESSRDEEKLNLYSFQTLQQTLRLIVPAAILITVGAPYILQLYGSNYAGEGAALLRLLCLSAIPYVVVAIYVSMARVQRKIHKIFFTYSALCLLVVSFTPVLLDAYGVTGVGWAWLLAQSLVMVGILAKDLRKAWLPLVKLRGPKWASAGRFSRGPSRASPAPADASSADAFGATEAASDALPKRSSL